MPVFGAYFNVVERNRAVIQNSRRPGESSTDAYLRCLSEGRLVSSSITARMAREAREQHAADACPVDDGKPVSLEKVHPGGYGTRSLSRDSTAYPEQLHAEADKP